MTGEIGKVVWVDGYIFYCPICKYRYDFAIRYDDFPDIFACRVCSSETIIDNASPRIDIRSPIEQTKLNELIRKKVKGYGDEKDWL